MLTTVREIPVNDRPDADFESWMIARQGRLLRTAYLLTGDVHAAEDLVQTALAKLYLAWDRVSDAPSVDAYARKMLVNEHTSMWRRLWRHREVVTDTSAHDVPVAGAEYDGVSAALWTAVHGHEPVTPAHGTKIDDSSLSLDGLTQGKAPRAGYFDGASLHTGSEVFTFDGSERVQTFARFKGGVMVAYADADGNLRAQMFDGARSWPMSGDFAVSDGGNVVAFVQPDGIPVVVQVDDQGDNQAFYDLPKIPRGSGFDVAAVVGEDCKERAENAGCTVWVNSLGEKPESWVSTSHGFSDTARPRLQSVADVVDGELVAGVTEVSDTGSCSEVEALDQDQPLWTTCNHRLVAFSPDGTKVLATNGYGDGLGDTQLAVYDSTDGAVLLDLAVAGQGFINRMVWEDDTHLLATMFQDGQWAVLRIGVDGSREYAVAPTGGEDVESPFVLPSR